MADAMEDSSTQRVTLKQREVMVSFMQQNNALATGRFATADGAKNRARLTREFSDKLNAVADGATKSSEKWMKCWQDWKSDIKKKAGKIQRHLRGTGGGPPCRLQLTQLEEQVINIMGAVAVCGQETVDPLDAQNKLLQERQAVNLPDPEPEASSSTIVLHSIPLHDIMDLNRDEVNHLMDATTTATALTVSLPRPSPLTSEYTDFSTEADVEPQRKRRKSECSGLTRSKEALDNIRTTTAQVNRQTVLKEKMYELECKRFELELAKEERKLKSTSVMEAMALAVTSAMQKLERYLDKK